MLGIVSENTEDFQRNRDRLESTFRGAGNNNGIVYNMIPVDPMTHKPSTTSKLVWVPFQNANDSLDLQTVNDVVNNRLSNALAVPDIIRGIDNGQTYANAEQAERAFIENTLKPLCMTVWDKWQFELDRITGGLGYGITFDLNLPSQTDVEKVQADTQKVRIDSLAQLLNMGASLESAVDTLGLPDSYKRLDLHQQAPTLTIPVAAKRYSRNIKPQETATEKRILPATRTYVDRVIRLARRSQNSLRDDLEAISDQWINDVEDDLMTNLAAYARRTGYAVEIENYTADDWRRLYFWTELPDTVHEAYVDHLRSVAKSTSKTITNNVLELLHRADVEQWDAKQLRDHLEQLGNDHAELIARCETVQSQRLGSLYSARNLSETLGIRLDKVWRTSGDGKVCEFCRHMEGTRIALDDTYLAENASVEVGDRTYVNNFESMQTPNGHPNCRCYEDYEVVES